MLLCWTPSSSRPLTQYVTLPPRSLPLLIRDQLMGRVPNDHARSKLDQLRQAFAEAEQAIPGVTAALVLEIVENVEQVEEH